ncbi:uncharacterized protein N7518_003966 [Penicillium psychrosexuale]|uniref:uncharacterized protein n=1 Tax=Penicillium psychrosexuale TaxID=1002107 RepID=UPI0025451ABA|nr:uncharacterized protein N7518_003966 [Penicillium psychrosexuale]KAJ5795426.1 hypothetical protein N7518_003966 [Penicillium psychrosexuale]
MPPPNPYGTPLSPTTAAPDPPRRSSIPTPAPVETDNAHDDNVNFLRSRPALFNPLLPSLSRQRRRRYPTNPPPQNEDRMEVDDPTNPRASVELNRRIPIVRHQERSTDMPNYEGRMPNSRSLYGWAPGSDDEDGTAREESEDDQMQPFLSSISSRDPPSARPPRNEAPGPAQLIPHDSATLPRSNQARTSISAVAALLQSARRQPRLSRSRTLENYIIDRYSDITPEEDAENTTAVASRGYRYRPTTRGDPHNTNLTHNDLRARAAAHRQLHSDTNMRNVLGETIHYLERIRHSNSLEDSMRVLVDSRIPFSMDSKSWRNANFIMYTRNIAPPAECSWLRSGMAFSGCQRAASAGCSILSQRIASPNAPSEPVIVNGSESARISVSTTSGRRYLANNRDENWPVKVTIHQINHEDMTLSGTMEAYNIPDKTSPTHDAHIVTFLEGEIIDFNNHTLATKNFKADADIDSTYWRELQPFKDLTDAEMARNLVNRKWITEELSQGWILMRWKERCFVTPTDARQGLTISGFYYISLRREDGHIEGLYYDPGSSPYQQLSLNPEVSKMVRPSYAFR